MLTDALPRKANRARFNESDRIRTLDLPQDGRVPSIAKSIQSAMESETSGDVRRFCAQFLSATSEFYQVPNCGIRVLAARPLRVRESGTLELFGDYDPESSVIRVWMRTAVRKEITPFGTFLSTLCHEFCHHLDFQKFGFPDSWHTRGFYERAAALYHHAGGRRKSDCSGCLCRAGGGASIGRGRIAVCDTLKTTRLTTPRPAFPGFAKASLSCSR